MFYWIKFPNDELARLDPQLNAGSVAIQNLLAMFYRKEAWQEALYGPDSFLSLYQQMFGDPWVRAATVEPLFLPGLAQPILELPFLPGEFWNLTGGPHYSWNTGTPRGALDFSPLDGASFCAVSPYWATACAPGIVARAAYNAVALDLDGDGYEQTGWVLVYYHLSENDLVLPGTRVEQDDPLGHPSCEGGDATGKHVHIARKYNGEWLAADGPIPFVLGGWWAHAGDSNYRGYLVKDDQIVSADPGGGGSSSIIR